MSSDDILIFGYNRDEVCLKWAGPVLDAAKVRAGTRVLDVACGTGILAREAIKITGSPGSAVWIDISLGMLEVARQQAPTCDWREGTAGQLPFLKESFDSAVSQFGIMFFPDRAKSIQEMYRVCAPGGRLGIAVWDSLENNTTFLEEINFIEMLAGNAAGAALREPFVLGDGYTLKDLVEENGFKNVELSSQTGLANFSSFGTLVEADVRGWLPVRGVALVKNLNLEIIAKGNQHFRT